MIPSSPFSNNFLKENLDLPKLLFGLVKSSVIVENPTQEKIPFINIFFSGNCKIAFTTFLSNNRKSPTLLGISVLPIFESTL